MIISIHAPRRGSDGSSGFSPATAARFQSTLPVGGATRLINALDAAHIFQSTLPVGGATTLSLRLLARTSNFNPRSPWGERPGLFHQHILRVEISIHAPRGGSDVGCGFWASGTLISIHAPRGGSDGGQRHAVAPLGISIHAPRGGATCLDEACAKKVMISIHAPRGGSDYDGRCGKARRKDFNPRSPWGERLVTIGEGIGWIRFQSTLPVGGATFRIDVVVIQRIFQSTLPVGGATFFHI